MLVPCLLACSQQQFVFVSAMSSHNSCLCILDFLRYCVYEDVIHNLSVVHLTSLHNLETTDPSIFSSHSSIALNS